MSENFEKLFSGLSDKKADLIILILTSQHIETRIERQNHLFDVLVSPGDRQKAVSMIELYYKENRFSKLKQQLQQIPLSSFMSPTAFMIMGLLWLIHAACLYYNIHEDMILKFGASALFILQGETYRAVTALFLHADARHLVGNMAGLLIFGAPLITLSGFGTGPFMLLFTGTLGNLMNAYLYKTAHLSIGSSTAIMGAAGLLVAYQVTQKKKPFSPDNYMPIIAGAVLVGMFSHGEKTDVMAHVLGFLSGLSSGIFFFPLNRIMQFAKKDLTVLIITFIIIASSILSGT